MLFAQEGILAWSSVDNGPYIESFTAQAFLLFVIFQDALVENFRLVFPKTHLHRHHIPHHRMNVSWTNANTLHIIHLHLNPKAGKNS